MAESKTQEHRPAPKEKKEADPNVLGDSGDLGRGLSPEGVPYQGASPGGKEHPGRERSEEDDAHDAHVAERLAELEGG